MTNTANARSGWLQPFLLRLHFYAGMLIGPFILVAAVSGALYALTPQLERVVYAHELRGSTETPALSLEAQVDAANAYIARAGDFDVTEAARAIVAVRPAPNIGDTTRVMYEAPELRESETRTVFVDTSTAEIRGDLTTYGTSGALPLRTWIEQFHRDLHLGTPGRIYSELAASWLGVIALAGLALWLYRYRQTRAKRDLIRPNLRASGYRKSISWHTSTGVWILVGALFLSATGITWSQFAGANVSELRAALNASTPTLNTSLGNKYGGSAPSTSPREHAEHASHSDHAAGSDMHHSIHDASTSAMFDTVLGVARTVNINVGLVEIRPPREATSAWTVQEIQRSFPTEVDAVAIDGSTLLVTDRLDFKNFGLAAKLARWGVDLHSGTMFGLLNQVLLFVAAGAIAMLVVLGYRMWWQRRPTRASDSRLAGGDPPPRGALMRAPWWGVATTLTIATGIALWLPLLGASLALFVLLDLARSLLLKFRRVV